MAEGRGTDPAYVRALIERLPDDSMTSALIRGGKRWREYFGWGMDRAIAANLYDMQSVTARAAGNWKKPPKFKPMPRPWDASNEPKKPVTLEDLFAAFTPGG